MNHTIDTLTLHAYLDGELNAEEYQRVETALAADPALAAQLGELRRLFSILDAVPEVEYRGDVGDLVLSRLHHKENLPGFIRVALIGQVASAALVLALAWPFLRLFTNAVRPANIFEPIEEMVRSTALEFEAYGSEIFTSISSLISQNTDLWASIPQVALSNNLLFGLAIAATAVWFLGNGVVFTRMIQR